jgi:Putative transposase
VVHRKRSRVPERLAEDANGDLVYLFTRPWSDGTTGITLSPLERLEKLAAIVPLPRAHLVRYAGCVTLQSTLQAAIIPTPRQQGVDGHEAKTGTLYWRWARLLGRVLARDRARCLPPLCGRREPCDLPLCRCGALRIIAALTQEAVITRILRHLKLASVPPPITPARCRQKIFAFDEAHDMSRGLGGCNPLPLRLFPRPSPPDSP